MRRPGPLAAVAAFGILLFGCGNRGDPSLIITSGHVEATDVRISTKVAGRLESFTLQEGDLVSAGQELARIDTVDIRLALDAARADRDQAAADLRLRLAGSRAEEISEAEAHAARAAADLAGAQRDMERMQGLLDEGSGTAKARDDAVTRRDMAESALRAAQERLRKLRSGSRPEEIDAARARLSGADARIAQMEQQRKDCRITSPVSGVLTGKLAFCRT